MARNSSNRDPYDHSPSEEDVAAPAVPCWLCGRPIFENTLIVNFTNSELQRHGMDVEGLLADPTVRKFVDRVANKDLDFTAGTATKGR